MWDYSQYYYSGAIDSFQPTVLKFSKYNVINNVLLSQIQGIIC